MAKHPVTGAHEEQYNNACSEGRQSAPRATTPLHPQPRGQRLVQHVVVEQVEALAQPAIVAYARFFLGMRGEIGHHRPASLRGQLLPVDKGLQVVFVARSHV
jgi:hypothetical protein